MARAAAPAYLGCQFDDASPALRFGLLLSVWTSRDDQERQVNEWAERGSAEGVEVRAFRGQKGMDETIEELRSRGRSLPGLWEKNDSAARETWKQVCALSQSAMQQQGH